LAQRRRGWDVDLKVWDEILVLTKFGLLKAPITMYLQQLGKRKLFLQRLWFEPIVLNWRLSYCGNFEDMPPDILLLLNVRVCLTL